MSSHTILGTTSTGDTLSLSLQERLRHIAVIGATGSGKSTLLRHIAAQDSERGDGLLLIDPMGDLSEAVLGDIPSRRHNHVCHFNLADIEYPVGLNVLEDVAPDDRARAVDGVVGAMHSIWHESWGPRMENVLRHACRVLLEVPNASLLLIPRLLVDDDFRKRVVSRVTDPFARAFFDQRFERWRDTFREEAIEPVLNKVEAFLAFPSVKNMLGQARSTLHLSYALQHGRIVVANLATGVVGETAARLTGALLLATLRSAAMARVSIPPDQRPPFHVLIDEAHSFGPTSLARLLSEIRQSGVSLVMSTQFLDGLAEVTRSALLANAKTVAAFRCDPGDATILGRRFNRLHQDFNATALLELEDGEAVVGVAGREAVRVSVPPPREVSSNEIVKRQSRRHYALPRAEIETKIKRALQYGVSPTE